MKHSIQTLIQILTNNDSLDMNNIEYSLNIVQGDEPIVGVEFEQPYLEMSTDKSPPYILDVMSQQNINILASYLHLPHHFHFRKHHNQGDDFSDHIHIHHLHHQ